MSRALKYGGNIQAGKYFGSELGREIAESEHLGSVDLVVPVPLHPLRKLRRGYNQAAVIGAAVARETGAAFCPWALRRRRRTSSQTRLDAEERARNVASAFRPSKRLSKLVSEGFPYRHVLLVDDVFTTGATLAASMVALRAVLPGEVRISVATLGCVHR